ncbi:hypothetical protein GOP47_0015982 [Adiantum capillus-veneris]|uniref:J domain-containing protein n=1 Tax=Adiantum capillus-veneris TaxID=13818 RepID=A0A9D4UKS0_ADICA|nr:hypothetical protein GOP47_0015982 [Adiantum capillus-veneris]
MDGNKDAAQKCLEIGNQALREGDKPRAHRFLSKAQRLDPSLSLQDLLLSLEQETNEQDADASREKDVGKESPSEQEASSSGAGMSSCNGNGPHTHKAAPEYTTEQVDIVRRIRKTKDYYQILGLEKECSSEEIRKAYRKVSLKVHPDKNKAPGADEAFKAVSKAFACLNEPELRQKYDQYGPEEANDVAQHRGPFHRNRNGFVYEDMFDPNEIFNAFFNGTPYAANGFQRTYHVRTGGGPRVHTREVHVGGMLNLLQLLPILALFLLTYFPFSSKPIYSLEHVAPYEVQYQTKENMVPFYVKSQEFDKDYPPGSMSRRNLESQIERDFLDVLRYHCRQELGWKQWHPSTKTPHCDRLQKFKVY